MVSTEGLAKVVDPSQLPSDLNGIFHYNHHSWLEMRFAVEECLTKANDLLDQYEDVKDQMEDLVTWLDDWKLEGHGQAENQSIDYLKENLQRHTDIRKRIRSETVDQLQALVQNVFQRYYALYWYPEIWLKNFAWTTISESSQMPSWTPALSFSIVSSNSPSQCMPFTKLLASCVILGSNANSN